MKTVEELKAEIISCNTDAFYKSGIWERKRVEILERDHYECQRCLGKFGFVKHVKITKANTVHHIVELKDAPDLMLNDDNLISLCRNCHDEVHGRIPKYFHKKKKRVTEERW